MSYPNALIGEVIETKELRAGSSSTPAVIAKKMSVAPLLRELQFTALGLCLTEKNTRYPQMKGGRASNKELAEHLKEALKELCDFINSIGIPCLVAWVFEKHQNGSPHIHCILFVPIALRELMITEMSRYLGEEAITPYPKISYLLKEIAQTHRKPKPVKFNLTRKTKTEYTEDGKSTYNCAKIKDVQNEKVLYFEQNKLMSRNFKETATILKETMKEIAAYTKKHRTGKRSKRHAANQDDVIVYDYVYYPTDAAETRAQARAQAQKPIKKENKLKLQKLKFSKINPETGQIELKTKHLNINLVAENGEKYHASEKIYVTTGEVIELKRKCRKLKSKKALRAYVCAYKTVKIKQEREEFKRTRLQELEERKSLLERDFALDVELGLEYYIRRYGGEIGRDERVRKEHEKYVLLRLEEQMKIDKSNMARAIRLDLPFWSPIISNPDGEIYYYEKMFAPAKDRPGVFLPVEDWLLDPQVQSIIELGVMIDFERRKIN